MAFPEHLQNCMILFFDRVVMVDLCGMCAFFHYVFAPPHGFINRLCSVIVALPGHLLYFIFFLLHFLFVYSFCFR